MDVLLFLKDYNWIIQLVVLGVVIPIARWIHQLQVNHLHDISQRLDRIEHKLDNHITWHLREPSNDR